MNVLIRHFSFAVLAAISCVATAATPEDPAAAGHVMLLTGRGSALAADGGAIRELHKDDAVFSGELVSAAGNSYVNLRFTDGSFILLRPNTRMMIETYAYPMAAEETRASPAPASSAKAAIPKTSRAAATAPVPSSPSKSGFFRLLKGGFRAVSGLIGRVDHEEYRVSTPVATIGIRGTDYYVYQCDAACDDDPVIAELIGNGKLPPSVAGATLVGVDRKSTRLNSSH